MRLDGRLQLEVLTITLNTFPPLERSVATMSSNSKQSLITGLSRRTQIESSEPMESRQDSGEDRRETSDDIARTGTIKTIFSKSIETLRSLSASQSTSGSSTAGTSREPWEGRPLQCPYYAADPRKYSDCGRVCSLDSIAKLKQHLRRRHAFSCTNHEYDYNISDAQWQTITQRSSGPRSERDKWYRLFKTMFPEHERPTVPYVPAPLSEPLREMQHFLTTEGPGELKYLLEAELLSEVRLSSHVYEMVETGFALAVWTLFSRWQDSQRARSQQIGLPEPLSAFTLSERDIASRSAGLYKGFESVTDSVNDASVSSKPFCSNASSNMSMAPSVSTAGTSISAGVSVPEAELEQRVSTYKWNGPSSFDQPESPMPLSFLDVSDQYSAWDPRELEALENTPQANSTLGESSDESLSEVDEDCDSECDQRWDWAVSFLIEMSENDAEFHTLAADYRTATNGQPQQSASSHADAGESQSRASQVPPENSRSSGKDKRKPQSNGKDSDGDDDQKRPKKRVSKRAVKVNEGHRNFACYFLANDSEKHATCFKFKSFGTPHRIKKHLDESHRMLIHCPICFLAFEDREKRDEHLRDRVCDDEDANRTPPEGITEDQWDKLEKLSTAGLTQEEQWKRRYKIIFPKDSRSIDPYIPIAIDEMNLALRDLFYRTAPAALLPEAESRGIDAQELMQNLLPIVRRTNARIFAMLDAARANKCDSQQVQSSNSSSAPLTPRDLSLAPRDSSHVGVLAESSSSLAEQFGQHDHSMETLPHLHDPLDTEPDLPGFQTWNFEGLPGDSNFGSNWYDPSIKASDHIMTDLQSDWPNTNQGPL